MADESGEGFFVRWSRRKRAAAPHRLPTPKASYTAADSVEVARPRIDPAALPPIETITADTDISGFLAPGIPSEVMQAALRRAWTTDPAVRDFIGLSESSWDFTAPDGVPGFGSLSAEDARRLLAQLTNETESDSGAAAAPEASVELPAAEPAAPEIRVAEAAPEPAKERASPQRRRHGGAVPG